MSSIQLVGFMQRSGWFHLPVARGALQRLGAVSLLALLAGCEGDVSMDMATELPADPAITQVIADIRGVEFRTSGGGTETLEFTDSQQLDFMDYSDDINTLRLFTSEELPEGTYTGVRLLFDQDLADEAFVSVTNSGDFPMNIAEGDFAPLDFELEDNENTSESFTLMLDLRKSLSFDDDNDEYTLTPVLRAVRTEDISRIDGNVAVSCPAGDSLIEGAVYLYEGRDITPDDLDRSGVEPFATAPVLGSQDNASLFYSLRILPPGDYTLALTCIGNDDDPVTDEDLEFRNIINVELDENEVLTRDLP